MERRSAQLNAAWLVRRLKARDFSALALLFERYHRLVYGVALRILDQPVGAENLTHTVFLEVWKSPDSVPEHDLAGWLAEITRSRALRRPQSLAAATPAAKESRLNSDRYNATQIRNALLDLSENERFVLNQGFYAGLSYEQIATQMKLPPERVKAIVRSALHRFANGLAGNARHAARPETGDRGAQAQEPTPMLRDISSG